MKKGKLSYLLICLILLLLLYPFVDRDELSGKILAVFFSLVLVSGVFAISSHKGKNLTISFLLAIPTIILIWCDQLFKSSTLDIMSFAFITLFSFHTMFCILAHLMKTEKVTRDILAGAASAYLLLGISWGMLCALLELINPGSFAVSGAIGADTLSKWSTFNYYSFTTLTTLGYGDISPVSVRAQSFAILEAITGVLFIALLISRLVGMYLYQITKRRDQEV